MARVLRAVWRRVPSSARSAESPSAWVFTLGFENGGGMCAHKNGVEDARDEAGTQDSHACNRYRPARDDGGGGEGPGREVVFDRVDRAWKVDGVPGAAGAGQAACRVRDVGEEQQPPGEGGKAACDAV